MLGMAAGFAGASLYGVDPATGAALVARAEDAARRSGNPYTIGAVAIATGRTLGLARRTDEAVERYGVAIDRFREVGDERMALAARSDLAHALRRGGRADEAAALYRETIGGWVHLGHRGAVANQLENVAYIAIDRGEHERAARLFGAAEALREAAESPRAMEEVPEFEAFVERARAAVPGAAFDLAWEAGRATSQADAVALAVAE